MRTPTTPSAARLTELLVLSMFRFIRENTRSVKHVERVGDHVHQRARSIRGSAIQHGNTTTILDAQGRY